MDDMYAPRGSTTAKTTRLRKSGLKRTIAGRERNKAFRKIVYAFYNKHGRDLPWRKTTNPYHILVSEIMLQQTQVDRVVAKYGHFIATFPDFQALATAEVKEVLAAWQGLGYNRRALTRCL